MVHLTVPGPPHTPDMVDGDQPRARRAATCTASAWPSTTAARPTRTCSAKGVEFIQEPADRPYGVEAVCRDNSGNWMVLVEQKAYTGEEFAHA